jgi:hypothetical protein
VAPEKNAQKKTSKPAGKAESAGEPARRGKKEIAALVGANLWNQARLPASQPLRGLIEKLRTSS